MLEEEFISIAVPVGNIHFPSYTGVRVMMMPFMANDIEGTIPEYLKGYKQILKNMLSMSPSHCEIWEDTPCYLTIDERIVKKGAIQRNPGLHIDGMLNSTLGAAWASPGPCGPPGGWGSIGNGMLVVSNIDNTLDVYIGKVNGFPINDGDCEHLRGTLDNCIKISPSKGQVIWADGLCLHEALPMKNTGERQFIRISLPNSGAWFEDYTSSDFGILPKGPILPARLPSQKILYSKVQ